MGIIKDRNSMGLTEAEDTKKRLQGNLEELDKKDLNDPDNHDGVITHLEPDILECKVKWASGSITTNKASGGNGIRKDKEEFDWVFFSLGCTAFMLLFLQPRIKSMLPAVEVWNLNHWTAKEVPLDLGLEGKRGYQ